MRLFQYLCVGTVMVILLWCLYGWMLPRHQSSSPRWNLWAMIAVLGTAAILAVVVLIGWIYFAGRVLGTYH